MVTVFAPVNIAWIKYMGKRAGLPTNASLSMTLSDVGTRTTLRRLGGSGELQFVWSKSGYIPPVAGQKKAEQFLKNETIWKEALQKLGYAYRAPLGAIQIETVNSVPAGTGIATSASGFAALTLAWLGILLEPELNQWTARFEQDLEVKRLVASLASLGSGSACRSFEGPFVEWDPKVGAHRIDSPDSEFMDFILLLDQNAKAVSSSDAHVRVLTSPKFSGRVERAQARLTQVKGALKEKNIGVLSQVVLEEALDMHELFATSEPSFQYMNESSKAWVARFQSGVAKLPSKNGIVTLDAGANVHVFVPVAEQKMWTQFFSTQAGLSYIPSQAGQGARYE